MSTATPHTRLSLAWVVVILLIPVALLNYLDRQMLAAMRSSIMADLPDIDTEAKWGHVLASFKYVYAVLSPVGGFLADRLSKRHVICVSLFVWSAVTWATGHVTSYDGLLATRALMGISEAFYIPAALALIANFHPRDTRSRAVGVHQMAIYAGIILGGFSGYAADEPGLGWRWAFEICGLVGVVYAIPLFLLLKNPPVGSGEDSHARPLESARELLTNRDFLLLVAYFTLPAIAGWVIKDWMPAILKEQFGLGQGKAGMSAVLYVQIASAIGAALGGFLADRAMRHTIRGRIFVSAAGVLLFLPSLFGIGHAATLGAAITFLIVFGLGWGFFDSNNMPILCQIVRPELRATGYGFMNLVSITFGGFADSGFGVLRDLRVPLDVIFGVFAGIALLSACIVLLIRPRTAAAG